MMINNTLPINSLKNKTIELFQKEMIEDIIINNQLNCKCLLIMDNISSNLISKYMSFSEIINSGIFSIDSIYKKRKPYKSFGAIYLISSNENTIKLVLDDFKSEKKRLYKWCFLFSINKIRDNIIELLLNKKFIRRIKALKEINISYIPLDKNLFYFGPKKNYNSLYHLFTNENNNKTINKIDIEKICSICKVTKTYPNIIYFIHDPICKILAIKINKKLKKYFEKIKIEKNGILLLISRKLDIIGPIQFDLTYGHLLFELYKNYNKKEENAIKINLEGKDQNIIFNYNDILYEKYKVMDLSQLMINLNKDIELFMQSDMAKLEKRENLNIEEMNTAVKNISEYKYLSPLYSRHLKIVEDINKKSIERNIMKIIDLQSTIISGANYKGKKKGANHILKKITENKNNFKKNDFMRLLCIIKYYNKESDINNLINIIESDLIKFNDNEKNIINFFSIENTKINEEILKNFDKYIILHRNKYKYNTQEEIENKKDKRYLCIKESKITTICDMLSKNEIPKDLFEYLEPPSNNINYENIKINIFNENNIKKDDKEKQNLIIYNIGGMSNYEISSLEKSNEIGQFNFNIIYGSNNIYNYEEYFNEIKEYLEGKNGIINENENEEELNLNNELEVKEEKRQKRKYKEDINKKEENEFDDNNNIKIEMKEIKSDEKEEKKDYNNIGTNKDKITKKKKNKKKKIEMNNINNDSLKEPLNSEDDLR